MSTQKSSSVQNRQKEQENANVFEQQRSSHDVLGVNENGQLKLFDLEVARQREVKRRLAVMGEYVRRDFDKKQLRDFAQSHYLPESILTSWKRAFQMRGEEGLLADDWNYLKEKSQQVVTERLGQLGNLVAKLDQGEVITLDDISDLMKRQNWPQPRKAERLVRRYQINGVWGLAPERDPERASRKRTQLPPPELAAVSDSAIEKAEQRRDLIKPYLGREHIPNEELRAYADSNGSSLETVRKYLRDFRTHGLRGLLPREHRSDKGSCHSMSPRMEGIIAGIRLSLREIPLHAVHEHAHQRALLLGEPEPTPWQVRQVCDHLPKEVKEIADERFGDYRSYHRMTYRYQFDGSVIVYQIDFTRVDVLLRDIRGRGIHTKSKTVRPWLITCVECSSGLVMSNLFTYDTPNSSNIASVLYDALVISENKPYGGIPAAVWVDQGNQLISNHMQQIARDLHFDLHIGKPNFPEDRGDPQKRGKVERPFRTFGTQLWSTLPGYTHSNSTDRHPQLEAVLTISELAVTFREYIVKYNHQVHGDNKQTPLEFWAEHCFAVPADPGEVGVLLQELGKREVSKGFIQYGSRRYWHDDLFEIPADAVVQIRAQPKEMRPDDILVLYEGQRICIAFALDSEAGRKVDGKRVLTAQRKQRISIQQTIDKNRAILHHAEQEIAERRQTLLQDATDEQAGNKELSSSKQSTDSSHTKRSHNALATSRRTTPLSSFAPAPQQRNTVWERVVAAKERHERQNRRTE